MMSSEEKILILILEHSVDGYRQSLKTFLFSHYYCVQHTLV